MKLTSVDTGLDQISFLLLQPSVVRELNLHMDYSRRPDTEKGTKADFQEGVPLNCRAVVVCHLYRSREPKEGFDQDIYIRGFAYCAENDKFCAVKAMKIALEDAAKQVRAIGESPWRKVVENQFLKRLFRGDANAIQKFNSEVEKRCGFNPYKEKFIGTFR